MTKQASKATLFLLFTNLFVFGFAWEASALPAFPGAEGMGVSTIGGRNGTIYFVTNLNDSGPGSFREAVEMPDRSHFGWEPMDVYLTRLENAGHRIVVFNVSGFIHLNSVLRINIPYITIAGQTSPGGIAFSGGSIQVRTHDVIMTHLRIRSGSDVCDPDNLNNTNECDVNGDALNIAGVDGVPVYNVIIDHCSVAWGNDETVEIGNWYADTYDVTISNSLIAEGLDDPAPENEHALGLIVYGKFASTRPTAATLHHNYMSNFRYRMPEIGGNSIADVRNNVAYNFQSFSMHSEYIPTQAHSAVNFVQNYTKRGPISNPCDVAGEVSFCDYSDPAGRCHAQDENAYQAMHVHGNLGCIRTNQSDPQWMVRTGWSPVEWLSISWQKADPFEMPGIPVTTKEMSDVYADEILKNVGATKPVRDSLDSRLIVEYYAGTGGIKSDIHWSDYPNGWPTFQSPDPPVDSDQDGMSDVWEISSFGSLSTSSSSDSDDDGYTNVEEYLHYLGGYETNFIYECSDGIDNDNDGNIDYPNDADCDSETDNEELICGDGTCDSSENCAICERDCGICQATYGLSNFLALLANWLTAGTIQTDINQDGIVNVRDIGIMMSNWE